MIRRSITYGPLVGCGLLIALAGCKEFEREVEQPGEERESITQEETAERPEQAEQPEQPFGEQPQPMEEQQQLTQIGVEKINFEGEATTVPEESKEKIRQFGQKVEQQPDMKVRVEAHVQELTNQQAAHQRANAVAQLLSQQGIDSSKVSMFLVQPVEPGGQAQQGEQAEDPGAQETGAEPPTTPTEPGAQEPGAEPPTTPTGMTQTGQGGVVELIPVYEAEAQRPQG